MGKDILKEIDMLKSIVRSLFPSVMKKKYIDNTTNYFIEHLTELENRVKNFIIEQIYGKTRIF